MSKELSERKKRILHALVDLYITTGQPVSSSDIQSQYLPEVSSATVRSELSGARGARLYRTAAYLSG